MVGITIGASFMVALVAGPLLASFIGVGGIFWLMVALALVGIAITLFVVPSPRQLRVHRDAETGAGADRSRCCATPNCCGSTSAFSRCTPC